MTSTALTTGEVAGQLEAGSTAVRWRGNGGFLSRWHVLEAAMGCFEAEGYEGVTIRAIAGRLGCSVGSIYRYFEDKQALLRACGSEALRHAVEHAEDPAKDVAEAGRAYVEAAGARPELYRLTMWLGDSEGRLPESVGRVIAGWGAKVGDGAAAQRRWALVHGLLCAGDVDAAAAAAEASGEVTTATAAEGADQPRAAWARRATEMEDVTLL